MSEAPGPSGPLGSSGRGSRRGRLVTVLRLAVGLVTLAFLLSWIDLGELGGGFARLRPVPVGIALALFVGVALLDAWRLRVTFSGPPTGLTYRRAISLTLIGMFWGNFTPGLVGAEVYKAAALARREADWVSSAVLITALRLLGLGTALVWAVVAVAAEPELIGRLGGGLDWTGGDPSSVLAVAAVGLGVALLAILVLPAAARLRRRLLALPNRVAEALRRLTGRQLLAVSAISLLLGLFRIGVLWTLAEAVEPGAVGPAATAVVVAVSILAIALPLSIGGLGIQEGAIVGLLALLGISAPDALAVALTQRAFLWALALLGGLLFVLARPGRHGRRGGGPPGGG